MGAFNRNIITEVDIQNLLDPGTGTPRTLEESPPAGVIPAALPAAAPAAAPGGMNVPTRDDLLTKLLKYVPLEVLGAYLFVEGIVTSNLEEGSDARQQWLFWILIASAGLAALYMKSVLSVVRVRQILMGSLGIAVYIFATGGWFATMDWYADWFGGIALVLFTLLVVVINVPPLPVDPPQLVDPPLSVDQRDP